MNVKSCVLSFFDRLCASFGPFRISNRHDPFGSCVFLDFHLILRWILSVYKLCKVFSRRVLDFNWLFCFGKDDDPVSKWEARGTLQWSYHLNILSLPPWELLDTVLSFDWLSLPDFSAFQMVPGFRGALGSATVFALWSLSLPLLRVCDCPLSLGSTACVLLLRALIPFPFWPWNLETRLSVINPIWNVSGKMGRVVTLGSGASLTADFLASGQTHIPFW